MDENQTSLDDVLGDAPVAQQETAAQPEATPEAEPAPAVEAEPEGSTPEPETWTKAAVMDERNKRQQYEKELSDAKQLIAQYQGYVQGLTPQQQAEEQAQAPDFWTDPEAALASTTESLKQEFTKEIAQMKQFQRDQHLTVSENMVSQTFEDFPEVKAHVEEMIKSNPAAVQQLMASNPSHPWLAVYQGGKKDMELQKVGDLDAYKASLREEMKAEALAEVKAELEASGKTLESVPTSLVNQPSKGSVKAGDWSGPTSLDSIL